MFYPCHPVYTRSLSSLSFRFYQSLITPTLIYLYVFSLPLTLLFIIKIKTTSFLTHSVQTNTTGPVSLVLDLHIVHECWGSRSDPSRNRHLHHSTLTIQIGDLMRLSLTRLENITPTKITIPLTKSVPLCISSKTQGVIILIIRLISLVRLGGYIVNLCVLYSYRIIGKLSESRKIYFLTQGTLTCTRDMTYYTSTGYHRDPTDPTILILDI